MCLPPQGCKHMPFSIFYFYYDNRLKFFARPFFKKAAQSPVKPSRFREDDTDGGAGADGGFQVNARAVQNGDMLDNGEP